MPEQGAKWNGGWADAGVIAWRSRGSHYPGEPAVPASLGGPGSHFDGAWTGDVILFSPWISGITESHPTLFRRSTNNRRSLPIGETTVLFIVDFPSSN